MFYVLYLLILRKREGKILEVIGILFAVVDVVLLGFLYGWVVRKTGFEPLPF